MSSPTGSAGPLRAVRVGLVCADGQAEPVLRFIEAAQGLGAQVTRIDAARALEDGAAVEEVARMLGRLYDAVACDGLPLLVVRRLAMAAQAPVLEVRGLLARADEVGSDAERRRRAAQAAVLAALRAC